MIRFLLLWFLGLAVWAPAEEPSANAPLQVTGYSAERPTGTCEVADNGSHLGRVEKAVRAVLRLHFWRQNTSF